MAVHGTSSGSCSSEDELKQRLQALLSVPGNLDTAANQIYDSLVEDVMLGVLFEVHQLNQLGGVPAMSEDEMKPFAIVDTVETDIFGQQHVKKFQDCCCPSCNRPLSASRFAPHLEKCLGMGRNSSRIASRRIANNCKENAYGGISDDDDDDWVAGQEKAKLNKKVETKKKKDKNGFRKPKSQKVVNDKTNSSKVSDDVNQSAKHESAEIKN